MLLSAIRYIRGYLSIQVSGYSPERFLNACSHRGIYLWGLKAGDRAYHMYVTVQGFRKLKPIVKKTGTRVAITGRFGLPFFLHRYRRRKTFFIGAFLSAALIYLMSLFIWNIDIRGNMSRTDETILEFLENKNVVHGMPKSNVDCARIVKDIRRQFDDIIWVSASIQGTRLIIQVKENEDSNLQESAPEKTDAQKSAVDLVADWDCTITEIVTRKGTPLVRVGDEVKKGDILVSGLIEVKNDNQEVTGYQTQHAEADIRGQIQLSYENSLPLVYEEKLYTDAKKIQGFLSVGEYFLQIGSVKNKYEQSDILTEEHTLCLGEHFYLPVSFGTRIVREYTSREVSYEREEIQTILTEEFERFLAELEKKGVEIIKNDVKIYRGQNLATARGTLTAIADIGEEAASLVPEIPAPEEGLEEGNAVNGND